MMAEWPLACWGAPGGNLGDSSAPQEGDGRRWLGDGQHPRLKPAAWLTSWLLPVPSPLTSDRSLNLSLTQFAHLLQVQRELKW